MILFFQTVKWCQYFKMLFIFIIMAWLRKWRFMKFYHAVIDCRHVCGYARRTDKTNVGETGPRAVSVGKSNAWCGGRGGTDLPPLSLVFEWIFPVHFELGSSLVDCVAPGHTVSSKVRPLPVVDVAGSERLLSAVLDSLLWSPSLTMASGKFAKHNDLWEAMVFHSGNMTSSSEQSRKGHFFF